VAPTPGAQALRQRAEQLAATLPPILVAAERVATSVIQGVHGRRRVGQGETFWQYRHYEPGDPIQVIDWRQSAKSDHVFTRQMEWEAAQSVWLWRDLSASMDWRSEERWPTKRRRADLLTLALAALLVRGGERVALLGTGMRPTTGRGALSRLAAAIADAATGEAGLPPVLPLPRYGQVVFVGDFLAPLEDVDELVRGYAERGVKGHLLQILDPAEEALPFEGRVRFEGLEGEEPWLLSRVEPVREDYRKRLVRQQEGLKAITRAAAWGWSFHRTDRPPQTALLALYAALSQNPGGSP
jgi:uncharacterized protein (DUF58 family)